MATLDVFIGGACISAVAVAGYALWGWHRRLKAFRAYKEDTFVLADVLAYPDIKAIADELVAEAKAASRAHKKCAYLWERAMEARKFQLLCEQRLRAADLDPAEILQREVA